MKRKDSRDFQITAFSCPKTLLRAAKRRARETKRSVSGHIQHLIEEDLQRANGQEAQTA